MPPAVPINYFAVLLAAVANMVIGFLWFGPIFGKQWIVLMGWSPDVVEKAKAKGGMGKTYILAFLSALVLSFVLAHSLVFASSYLQVSGVMAGLQAGFWNWLGFVVPVVLATVLWEGRSWALWLINVSYYLVSFLVMGVILAVWP